MSKEAKIFSKMRHYVVRYVKEYVNEANEKGNVVGVYENIKKQLVYDADNKCYREEFVMILTVVHNGPFVELSKMDTPSDKVFIGGPSTNENGELVSEDDLFVVVNNTSLQDYVDYSLCADLYNGVVLLDNFGALEEIKQEFAKDITPTDLETFKREQVNVVDESAVLIRK